MILQNSEATLQIWRMTLQDLQRILQIWRMTLQDSQTILQIRRMTLQDSKKNGYFLLPINKHTDIDRDQQKTPNLCFKHTQKSRTYTSIIPIQDSRNENKCTWMTALANPDLQSSSNLDLQSSINPESQTSGRRYQNRKWQWANFGDDTILTKLRILRSTRKHKSKKKDCLSDFLVINILYKHILLQNMKDWMVIY